MVLLLIWALCGALGFLIVVYMTGEVSLADLVLGLPVFMIAGMPALLICLIILPIVNDKILWKRKS